MSAKTLFLAWRDKRDKRENSREWFPVGRLDADLERPNYRFRYIKGAERAKRDAKFPSLRFAFPELNGDYRSPVLFPIFRNRVMSEKRPDFATYIRNLGFVETPNPIDILSISEGWRVTDPYEVFPKINIQPDGSFTCRFFLHGWRYVNALAQKRIESLRPDEELYVAIELNNPATGFAVQIQTREDYHMIGWTPRYLVNDLVNGMAKSPKPDYSAKVVQVNPMPVPSNQRVLVEMQGRWGAGYEPMSGPDFAPLVE